MPRYQTQLTVPAGTTQPNAVSTEIEVDERVVQRVVRFTPPGSAYTVKAVVQSGEAQLSPAPESDPTVLPGLTEPEPVQAVLPGSPSIVSIRAWAPTATNDHTITVTVDMRENFPADQRLLSLLSGGIGGVSRQSISPEDISDQSSD